MITGPRTPSRYKLSQNRVGRCSIIDVFTNEPAIFGHIHLINLHPGEATDIVDVLNDLDRLERRVSSIAEL
mgnify:FL=1|tara:strand:+ start:102 stop:314 length:213 start_codon:yes stop_codon:yes gene_type:complete